MMSEKLFISTNSISNYSENELELALRLVTDQLKGNIEREYHSNVATYIIYDYNTDPDWSLITADQIHDGGKSVRAYSMFHSIDECIEAIKKLNPIEYKWQWKYTKDTGYEVTSRGDRRFSPFFQYIMYDNVRISLEDYYHKVIKPLKESGQYIEGTGHKLMKDYLFNRPGLLYELACIGLFNPFTDMFDKYGGQNKWYSEILNEIIKL